MFVSNCDSVEFHCALLGRAISLSEEDSDEDETPLIPVPILKLHGDMTQTERKPTYDKFNKTDAAVLICTDVGMLSFGVV